MVLHSTVDGLIFADGDESVKSVSSGSMGLNSLMILLFVADLILFTIKPEYGFYGLILTLIYKEVK